MRHVLNHGLGRERAGRATRKALEAYAERYQAQSVAVEWPDPHRARFQFSAAGYKLQGELTVEEQILVLDVQVPLLLRMFEKQATSMLDAEFQRWLAREQAGELDL